MSVNQLQNEQRLEIGRKLLEEYGLARDVTGLISLRTFWWIQVQFYMEELFVKANSNLEGLFQH